MLRSESTPRALTIRPCSRSECVPKPRRVEATPDSAGRGGWTICSAALSTQKMATGARGRAADVGARVVGHRGDLPGGADQPSIGGVALDERGVVLHADGGRELRDQAAQVGGA